jgi:hypothetical protein
MNLRKAARDKACVLCGREDGTTVLAHLNAAGHFGMGLKAPDFPWAACLCATCHRYVDGDGRGDWKTKFLAMGRQMEAYARDGVVRLA